MGSGGIGGGGGIDGADGSSSNFTVVRRAGRVVSERSEAGVLGTGDMVVGRQSLCMKDGRLLGCLGLGAEHVVAERLRCAWVIWGE